MARAFYLTHLLKVSRRPTTMHTIRDIRSCLRCMLRAEEEVDPRILTAKMRENFFSLHTILGIEWTLAR